MVQSASKDIEFSGELAGMSELGIIALISVIVNFWLQLLCYQTLTEIFGSEVLHFLSPLCSQTCSSLVCLSKMSKGVLNCQQQSLWLDYSLVVTLGCSWKISMIERHVCRNICFLSSYEHEILNLHTHFPITRYAREYAFCFVMISFELWELG